MTPISVRATSTRALRHGASLLGAGLALALVATLRSLVGDPGMAALVYLVPVTLAAARWGRGPAYTAVVASVAGHDLLFVEPVGTFTIARLDEGVGLLLLLLATATTVTQLADAARQGAARVQEAEVSRRADALKSALLRAVSHDLRTPLASIKACVSSLRQAGPGLTQADREDLLAAIEEETDRLNRLVGHLLDASRLEAGVLKPAMKPEDLGELARAVVRRLAPVIGAHPIALAIPEGLPEVVCDYSLIDQVVTNLVENAARHTPADTQIRVALSLGEQVVTCEVTDDGPGLDPELAHRLFTSLERGPFTGPSLGLSIARGLVEAHGSRLLFTPATGGGSTFRFSLQVAA